MCAIFLSVAAICFTTSVIAQSTTATISGLVLDSAGKVITDADVAILNEATGLQYNSKTNNVGLYAVSILPPGQYRVQVSKNGYKTIIKSDTTLNVQSAVALNFTLPVGAASESITVEGESSLINTTDASVSTVVDHAFVENMPLNGRSFQDLIAMTPGVTTQSSQQTAAIGEQGDFSVNGQRTESNAYSVDGVSGNINAGYPNGYPQAATGGTVAAGTALGTTQSLISVDALQEFRISSSSYSAEFGRSPGGQISLSTRSGTNILHGTIFDYLRNDIFDANDWFNNHNGAPKTAIRQNDFGGTVGGPIRIGKLYDGRDKSFFFVSYEGLRLVVPTAATTQYVPSLAVRAGTTDTLKPIFSAFPLPTGPEIQIPCSTGTNNCPNGQPTGTLVPSGLSSFVKNYSLPGDIDSTSVRLDHRISSKHSAFFRVGYTPTTASSRTLSSLAKQSFKTTTYTFGVTSQLTNNISNEFRYGYAESKSDNNVSLDTFGGAVPIDMAAAFGIPASYPSTQPEPYLTVSGVGTTYVYPYHVNNQLAQTNVTDTFALTRGHHSFRLGIDYRHFDSPLNPPLFTGFGFFYTRQEMLSNITDSIQLTKRIGSDPIFNQFSAFVQDEWKVLPALTVSMGVRWDISPPPKGSNGNDAYALRGNLSDPSSITVAPKGTPPWNTAYFNFAPRLGVAWVVHPSSGWETVVRGGGGVFFDTGSQNATLGYTGIGFQSTKTASSTPLPFTPAQLDFSVSASAPYTSDVAYGFPQHLQSPYTLEWNAAVQQSLGKSQALTLTYIGSNGRRLQQAQIIRNPNFELLYYFPSGVTSNYNALQATLQRSIVRGLQGLASYTWSHSFDYGSTSASYPATYGNSDFDIRSNFQAGLSWTLSGYTNNEVVKSLLNGWGLDGRVNARTAFPITLTGNSLFDASGSLYYSGVNYDSSRPTYLYGSRYPGGKAINGGVNNPNTPAFYLPTGTSAGNAPRNLVRAFGALQINTAVRREFRLYEGLNLQFRAEAFNVLNHPVFGYVDPTLTDALFGKTTKTLSQSLGASSALYQQGGPRSMQFALKLLF
ncbi:TonB-dependent receptor [Granulicella sp. WH15]|nr:TonB-dependent receptor [Granulicella sp. WH15]